MQCFSQPFSSSIAKNLNSGFVNRNNMDAKLLVYILCFLVLIQSVLGSVISSYQSDYVIDGNGVNVKTSVKFESYTGVFKISIPAKEVDVMVDNSPVDVKVSDGIVSMDLLNAQSIDLEYLTESIEKSSFLLDLIVPYDVYDLKISLTLPDGAILKESLGENKGSIYPKPDEALTDGRRMIFVWNRRDLEQGQEIPIYVRYKESFNANIIWFMLVPIILTLGVFWKKSRPKEIENTPYLKEEEEAIVNILKHKGGSCEQGTLRVITSMPKASLSRLLKELEDRKVIYKEKRGKRNLVFLK